MYSVAKSYLYMFNVKNLVIWREAELILRIWGAKEKFIQEAEGFSFRDLGRSMHYFMNQGSTPPASCPTKGCDCCRKVPTTKPSLVKMTPGGSH